MTNAFVPLTPKGKYAPPEIWNAGIIYWFYWIISSLSLSAMFSDIRWVIGRYLKEVWAHFKWRGITLLTKSILAYSGEISWWVQ